MTYNNLTFTEKIKTMDINAKFHKNLGVVLRELGGLHDRMDRAYRFGEEDPNEVLEKFIETGPSTYALEAIGALYELTKLDG